VTDDSCTLEYIEIVPLDRPSDDYHTSEFIYPVVEVKPEDPKEMKQEPADENDNEDSHCYVKQELADGNDNGDSHCYVKQEPVVGYAFVGSCFTTQVSPFTFVFHMFLHVMKLLEYKSTIGQEQSTLLHSARQTLCSQVAALFCVKMTSWPPS